ncbi:MAG: S-layer homology domain-containing protein, partial [Acidimicrobiia bacterium]|nr:S-layer homology domain-containing protein [Acidimicrobiia bacterium]
DVADSFASQDVGRVYGLGITTGTSNTTYSPKDQVTREQMAAFLARLYRVLTTPNS